MGFRMAKRTQDECRDGLGQHFGTLHDAVIAAIQHYWTSYKDDVHKHTAGSRAFLVRDLMNDELKQRLDKVPGIEIVPKGQKTLFCIGTDWVVQVHKLNAAAAHATNDTQACLFMAQNDLEQADLPGIPEEATLVVLGYRENVIERMTPEVLLTCPDGDKPAWIIDLGKGAQPSPGPEITRPGPQSGTEVVVRTGKKQKISP